MPPPWSNWDEERQWAFLTLPSPGWFPQLSRVGFVIDDVTSPYTIDYNCIAFAAKDYTQPWWPMPHHISLRYYYWPPGLPREYPATIENFINAFKTLGYEQCKSAERERGYEKVAIYVTANNEPTHMARELGDGVWFSKLGDFQDIRQHTLEAVETASYGQPKYFMRRRLSGFSIWQRIQARVRKVLS
jgi:hypothetical protein